MLLMIDNFDSFCYNLVQYFMELGEEVKVMRNNEITVQQALEMLPDGIVISPGPCDPYKAGISMELIKEMGGKVPILGVCLGHQCIGQVFGARTVRALRPVHGHVHLIWHDGKGLFFNLPNPLHVTRYHSLVLDEQSIPDCLEITARTKEGEIMGIRHKFMPIEGIQFHPEAILTEKGHELLKNFLDMITEYKNKKKENHHDY